ncbi:DUF3298 and DUF4163 domain-containing protein [Candidatus Thiothrix anitrata]|uniref:DUF3298 and DUF4163 domain-containing protein n=1 Tax=Candidatus Thiothrix anitrata TaxID=2823902 RepID=A0ABX7X798_9GAMM|nr:DUF3298 and DUF4163 domain-containing protein [Candidatus Thiothrix anitrata]QTR50858.1 DUF3298 and DUF4163 domain-containing protein [Candidatus Thiothrix anitrata]
MSVSKWLLLVGCLFLSACKWEMPLLGGEVPLPAGLTVEQIEFQRNGGPQCLGNPGVTAENMQCASVRVSYPKVVSTLNATAVDAINQFIMSQLIEFSDEEGKQAASLEELAAMFIADYQKTPNPLSSWELERRVEMVFSSGNLMTLNFTENGYTGGAHPFSGERYFVFDMVTGKQVTLAGLLTPGYDGVLNVAAEKAFREARHIDSDANLETEGFWFENNVFSVNTNFGVLEHGLIFVFNPYEVAPYVMGPTEFTVPYEDIADVLAVDSPLAALR